MPKNQTDVKFTMPNGIKWTVTPNTPVADMLAGSVKRTLSDAEKKVNSKN